MAARTAFWESDNDTLAMDRADGVGRDRRASRGGSLKEKNTRETPRDIGKEAVGPFCMPIEIMADKGFGGVRYRVSLFCFLNPDHVLSFQQTVKKYNHGWRKCKYIIYIVRFHRELTGLLGLFNHMCCWNLPF